MTAQSISTDRVGHHGDTERTRPRGRRSSGALRRRAYYVFVARGAVALSLGVILLSTGSNLNQLTTFVALYWIVAAVLTLHWVGVHRATPHRSLTFVAGSIALVAGLAVVLRHVLENVVGRGVLLDVLGASAILMGFLRLLGTIHDDQLAGERPRLRYRVAVGVLEVLLGIALVVTENGPSTASRLVIAIWALAMGTFLILDAWTMRRLAKASDAGGGVTSWTRRSRFRRYTSTAAWPIPAAYVLLAIALGIVVPLIDRSLGNAVPVRFGVGAAQGLLTAFATGLITVMGFIIAVVIAGLTFSSTAVTPRIVREMQRNTTIRHVSGLLLLSVVYAFLVLNRVAPPGEPNYVPDLAVWVITPLLVLDVAGLLVLVREMGHALRLIEIIDRVHHRAEQVIVSMYPTEIGPAEGDPSPPDVLDHPEVTVRNDQRSGVVASIDVRGLVAEALRVDTSMQFACPIGSYLPVGAALLQVADLRPDLDEEYLQEAVALDDERTIDQDPLYALRLLVDMATRALSPAVNDPTTAVQVLDRIESILRLLGSRRLDTGTIRDDEGIVRLIVPLPTWEDFLSVGLTEIRHYGADSTQVMRRLRAVLDTVSSDVPESRRAAVEYQRVLLDQTIATHYADPAERELALVADRQGLGEPARMRGNGPGGIQHSCRNGALAQERTTG
jgi:uncharacterized membrane protein/uncharacterized membrane protein HdeD (DUF308 family)